MATPSLPDYDADEARREWRNKHKKKSENVLVLPETKYAAVLLKLAPGVLEEHYPQLKSDIIAITGIQDVPLLIDGVTDPVEEDEQLRAYVEVAVRCENIPE